MTETLKIDLYAKNLDATQAIAAQLAQIVPIGTIILLEGNLGSGKTTFMQAFGYALGISTTIASPTFTLIDEYTEGRLPLYHIDLYRLEPSQVPSLHLEEYWRGEDFPLGVVAIEWASKLPTIPSQYLKVNLSTPARSFCDKDIYLSQADALDEDFIDALSSDRLIQLIAQGKTYVELLNQLQSTSQEDFAKVN